MEIVRLITETWSENDRWQAMAAGGVAVGSLLLAWATRRWLQRRYRKLAGTDRVELMELPLEVASRTSMLFLVVVSLAAGLSFLTVPDPVRTGAMSIATVAAFWQVGLWGSAAVIAWLRARRRTAADGDRAAVGSLGIIGFVLRGAVWTLVLLLALENLGVDVTALVAGLGVGGIAVALAVQNVLGDLFASLSITLDRPFVIGDFIVVGDYMGSVEQIGIKSTRLRSLGGEQIIMANADLLSSRVRNYGRMFERRVVFSLGVTYETSREQLQRIPALIRERVEQQEGARFDRSHFSSFGDFALEFETVYYVLSPDYTRFMDVQQAVYFAIHEAFERQGIEFAYPTHKVWLARGDDGEASATLPGEGQ